MLVGFNYPVSHNRFGDQIGPELWVDPGTFAKYDRMEAAGDLSSIPLPGLFDKVDRNLANLKKMGVKVVRWFLLGNGNNYGPRPIEVWRPPQKVSPKFTPPSNLDKRFRRDFTELLSRFRKLEMQIIPSLISFEFGSDVKCGPGPNGMWYG